MYLRCHNHHGNTPLIISAHRTHCAEYTVAEPVVVPFDASAMITFFMRILITENVFIDITLFKRPLSPNLPKILKKH
jgi:hypothetical protein